MKKLHWATHALLVLALGLPTLTVSASAPGKQLAARSASMALSSSLPGPMLVGDEIAFDLSFAVDQIEPGVSGADIYLGYNPALVTPPTSSGAAAAEVLPDFFGVSNFSINEVLPAAQCPGGATPCVHLVVAGPAQASQSGVAARFHFRALAQGTVCFSILQSTMVDANGFQVEHTRATDLCRTIQGRTTGGTILRQGVPANPNPGGGSLACAKVTATGAWAYGPVTSNAAGVYNLPNLPTGTYTVRATYSGYLPSEKTGIAISANALTITIETVTLRGGDVNGDNAINILDIGSIISKFGRASVTVGSYSAASCGGDEAVDINDDGLINISDLAIAAGNWGLVGPTRWP